MLIASAFGTMGLLIGLIVVGENSDDGIKTAFGAESDYSITFDKNTNKIGTDAWVSPSTVYSGSGFATTGLGNNIGFAYSSFANPTTVWQLIKGGGYFTNTDPISGMKSITLTKSNTSSGFQIYWSETTAFTETNSAKYDTTSALTFTCDFSGYSPNYVKVLALGTGTDAITSGSILFSCANLYPTLTLTADHAEMGSVSGGGIHKIGSSVALAATPNSGYKFVGWYHGTELLSTDASYTFAMPNCVNNYDVEGRFLLNSYNLVLSSEDTAKGSVTGAGSYDYATPVSISAAAENGYTFSGWYSGTTLISSANPYSFTMPYTDLNYVAKFNTNSYKLSLTYDSSKGYVSGTGAYSYGSSVTISATAKSGYSFSGWYDGETLVSSSGSYSFSMPYNDLAYEARFSVNNYGIVLSSSEVATTPVGTCEVSGAGTYAYGSSVTIVATPASGYGFLGWYDGNTLISSSASYSFSMPYKSLSFVAKYSKIYHLSVSSYDEAKGTVSGSGDFAYTSSVTAVASPIGNLTGVTWYDDSFNPVSSKAQYSFTMPESDVNLSADFVSQYTITFKNWDGTVLQTGKWNEGVTPVYSGATPTKAPALKTSASFAGWSPEIVAASADCTYVAQYSTAASTTLGSSFTLGRYPQTVVEDSTLLTALASASDADSDGYLEYGSDEYKKVTGAPRTSGYKSVSANVTFASGTVYYFKVEPIQWRVLSGKGTATGLVMAEKVLTNSCYYPNYNTYRTISGSTVYANNYKYSTLRAMLNGLDGSAYSVGSFAGKGFLDVAFTEAEKAYITTTTVDNSVATTGFSSNPFACANTSDRIFALSCQDLKNTSYGFNSSYSNYDTARCGVLTDYARATGAWMSTGSSYYGNGCWWSRSPYGGHFGYAWHVRDVGDLDDYGDIVDDAGNGVRPSFTVSIG